MEFSRNKVDCAQQLNTKGCCFLCLDDVEENKINNGEDRHLFSIQCLLRHLRITSFDKQIFPGKNIEVDLCETCQKTLKGLTNVLAELEKVQMKMNYFLERISKSISSSKKDSKRVQVYSKRMTDDPVTLAQLASVDKLRNELAVKSHENKVGRIAVVKLKRISNRVVKQESSQDLTTIKEVEDDFNHENSDFDLDHSPEISEPDAGFLLSPRDESSEPIKKEEVNGSPDSTGLKTKIQKDRKYRSRSIYYTKVEGTGMFQCRKCKKTCRSHAAIIYHFQSVHLKQRFKCDICNISSYVQHSDLKVHQKTCRETLEERLAKEEERKGFEFACDLCGKRFRDKKALQEHQIYVHRNINRYACNLCDKKYTKSSSLKEHKNAIHFGKKLHCRFCKKAVLRKGHLRSHEKKCEQRMKIKTEPEEK